MKGKKIEIQRKQNSWNRLVLGLFLEMRQRKKQDEGICELLIYLKFSGFGSMIQSFLFYVCPTNVSCVKKYGKHIGRTRCGGGYVWWKMAIPEGFSFLSFSYFAALLAIKCRYADLISP